jgi:glycosyltransferase involved in cell wall biosynthesis
MNLEINPKIILVSIIRNESVIIRRCLNSVKHLVSAYCICDTGSTDNTIDILREYHDEIAQTHPVHIAQHEWRNFGYNRSLSFTECQNWIHNEVGWDLTDCWAVFIDADMILCIEKMDVLRNLLANSKKSNIPEIPYFQLQQRNRDLIYWNTRIVCLAQNWECLGVTHEYWTCSNAPNVIKIASDILWINDQNDGGCKADKYERDARLLEEGIINPETPEILQTRYYFYLAQTYMAINQYSKAIINYDKRIEKGAWIEEVWYCHYQKYKITRDHTDLWKSVELIPNRIESIYYHLKNKRMRGEKYTQEDYGLGAIGYSALCKRIENGKKINNKNPVYLFMEYDVYDWSFLDEFSIAAYYTDHKEEGKEAIEQILTLPINIKNNILPKNMKRIMNNFIFFNQ